MRFSVTPPSPSYKNVMPTKAVAIDRAFTKLNRSLKNSAIITATSTGYMNRIVDAMPASM